jgi:hypothetical protein
MKPIVLLTLGVILSLWITEASAQPAVCYPRDEMLSGLKNKYQERTIAMGVTATGNLMELLTSPEGRTWTLIMTLPSGTACMIGAGEGWENLPVAKGPES